MSTRSAIAVKHGDTFKGVYCHFDGYVSGVGATLLKHYDSAKANELVSLGDISVLGEVIGEKHPFDGYNLNKTDPNYATDAALLKRAEDEDWCKFYGRDRGEKNVGYEVSHSLAQFISHFKHAGCEYFYVMDNGVWFVAKTARGGLTELANVFEEEEA